MRTNDSRPFDGVADSMAQAAALLGVPLETIKAAKRSGSTAFRGSRVNVTQLREEIGCAGKPPTTGNILLMIAEQVASIVAEKLLRCRGARFEADSDKICQAVHNGFALALCVV